MLTATIGLNLIMVPAATVGTGRIDGAQPAGFDNVPHVMSSVKRADNSANIYMDGASVISGTMTGYSCDYRDWNFCYWRFRYHG